MTGNCHRCRKRDTTCTSLDQQKQQSSPYDCNDFEPVAQREGVSGKNWT